jgi:hypothetical protein
MLIDSDVHGQMTPESAVTLIDGVLAREEAK